MNISIFPAVLALFLIPGIIALGIACHDAWRSASAASWPSVVGKIDSCALRESTASNAKGATMYSAEVKYSYSVDGHKFENTRLAIGYHASGGREAHAEIVEALRRSTKVKVRYDPNDPSNSVLSYGVHQSHRSAVAFGAMWVVVCSAIGLVYFMRQSSDEVLIKNIELVEVDVIEGPRGTKRAENGRR